jgi:hypothetical protein
MNLSQWIFSVFLRDLQVGFVHTCFDSNLSNNWAQTFLLHTLPYIPAATLAFPIILFFIKIDLGFPLLVFLYLDFFTSWDEMKERYWHLNSAKHTCYFHSRNVIITIIIGVKCRGTQNSVNTYLLSTLNTQHSARQH